MRYLRPLLRLVDVLGLLGGFSGQEMADEFTNWTQRELNFTLEGRAADRVRLHAVPYEVVPKIYWDLTTSKVRTMEFIEGLSLARVGDLLEAGKVDEINARLPNLDIE